MPFDLAQGTPSLGGVEGKPQVVLPRFTYKFFFCLCCTVNFLRPFLRLRASTFRPFAVRLLLRNPCLRSRRRHLSLRNIGRSVATGNAKNKGQLPPGISIP